MINAAYHAKARATEKLMNEGNFSREAMEAAHAQIDKDFQIAGQRAKQGYEYAYNPESGNFAQSSFRESALANGPYTKTNYGTIRYVEQPDGSVHSARMAGNKMLGYGAIIGDGAEEAAYRDADLLSGITTTTSLPDGLRVTEIPVTREQALDYDLNTINHIGK